MTTHGDSLRLPDGFWERPLTARQLEDFARCPHKFLLSQFIQRQDTRRFLGGPAALHHALRTAIVQFYQQRGSVQNAENVLLDLFEDAWDGSLCSDSMEEEGLHRQGRQIVAEFAGDWVSQRHQVLHTDLQLTGKLGGGVFSAVADLVFGPDEGSSPVQVVRLNSSRRPPSETQLAEDVSAGLLLLLTTKRFAPRPVEVGYYCLRPGRLNAVQLTFEGLEHVRDTLSARVSLMRREIDFEPRKGSHCRWCRVRGRCVAWKR